VGIGALGQILTDESVGVLVESALPGMVGVGCRSLQGMCLIGPLGIGKRYAARVFHNWSKEARDTVLPGFVLLWKDRLTAASSARCPADDGVKRGEGGVEGVRRERDHASEVLFICAITAEGCGDRIYPMRKSNVLSKSTVRVI